jgi:hypothetical protein
MRMRDREEGGNRVAYEMTAEQQKECMRMKVSRHRGRRKIVYDAVWWMETLVCGLASLVYLGSLVR